MTDPTDDEPQNPIEHVLDAAIEAAVKLTGEAGGEVEYLAVFAHATGLGEPNAGSAGYGFEDSRELLAFLVTQAMTLAEAHGLTMDLVGFDGPVGEG